MVCKNINVPQLMPKIPFWMLASLSNVFVTFDKLLYTDTHALQHVVFISCEVLLFYFNLSDVKQNWLNNVFYVPMLCRICFRSGHVQTMFYVSHLFVIVFWIKQNGLNIKQLKYAWNKTCDIHTFQLLSLSTSVLFPTYVASRPAHTYLANVLSFKTNMVDPLIHLTCLVLPPETSFREITTGTYLNYSLVHIR